jgi:hypothetical protein
MKFSIFSSLGSVVHNISGEIIVWSRFFSQMLYIDDDGSSIWHMPLMMIDEDIFD